jgi:hypothetical protein
MIFLCGIGGTLVGLWGYFSPAIRNVGEILPDHVILTTTVTVSVAQEQPLPAEDNSLG